MDNLEKKDWFGLYYSNQDKTYIDFLQNGITPNDIELKSKDEYKQNEKIIQAFTSPDGKFDDNAFNTFYDKALSSYNTLSIGQFTEEDLPKVQYDIMSPFKSQLSPVQDISLDIIKTKNPFIQSTGLNTILGTEMTSMSTREMAQQNKIFDTENNRWMDLTPEDLGFWGTVTKTPIVLAQYDKDVQETDPETGRLIQHKKGEIKLDETGMPYYETLGNREVHGKQVLSAFDVITRENSTWNKFDFFDNDGEESSIGSTIAQTVASIAPLFIPYVGQAYAGALVLREGTKLGITLYKMLDGAISNNPNPNFGILNTIEAKANQFNTSVSDKSQEKLLTFENFGRLVSDIGSQLFQQRLLAQIPNWLGIGNSERAALKAIKAKYGDEVVKAISDGSIIQNRGLYNTITYSDPAVINAINKANIRNNFLGRFMANFYMSGTSTMDVYNDALDAGYDRRTAALTAGLAMGATTWMIQSTEIGQKALEGLGFDSERAIIRNAGKKFIEENRELLHYTANNTTDKAAFNSVLRKAINTFKKVKEPIDNIISNSGIASNAVAEGIEEMSEEAIMDMSKAITDVFTGITGTQKDASFDFLASNPLERYLMAGFGGAIGGAIFKAANNLSDINKRIPDQATDNIFYILRNGGKSKLISELERLRQQGVAPKNLSATNRTIEGENINYSPVESGDISQNDAVIDLSLQLINQWDAIINEENLRLSDEELISLSALRDKRVEDLIKFDGRLDIIKDYNQLGKEIGNLLLEKKDIENQLNAPNKEIPNKAELEGRLNIIDQELQQKRAEKEVLLQGGKSEEYLKRALFNISEISNKIYSSDIYTYTENVLGKSYGSLSESEREEIKVRYKAYREDNNEKFDKAYKIFTSLSEKYGGDILNVVSKISLLNKIKGYLSEIDEEALFNLDEDAKRNFDLARKLGIELGVPVERGVDYIFEYRNIDLSDLNTQNVIKNFFNSINQDGSGIDVSGILSTYKNSGEFISDIFDSIFNIDQKIDSLSDSIIDKLKVDPTLDKNLVIKESLGEFLNTNVSNPILRSYIQNNLNLSGLNSPEETVSNIRKILINLSGLLQFNLIPQLRTRSMMNLIESAKNEGVQLTKDLYSYIKTYLKSDNKIELDYSSYVSNLLSYVDESLGELVNYDLQNIKSQSPDFQLALKEGFEEIGVVNLEEVLRISEELKSVKDWFEVASLLKTSTLNDVEKRIIIDSINDSNKSKTKSSLSEINILSEASVDSSQLVENPLNILLSNIYLNIDESAGSINIFELLSNESDLLKSTNTLSDYVLQGKVKSEQLDTAINVINALQSVVSSMQSSTIENGGYGFNSTLNYVREKLGVSEKLPEIESNSAFEVIQELERIKNKLGFYKKLSEQNKGNKLKEHKLTAIRTRQALIKNYQDKLFRNKAPELFDGVDDILSNYNLDNLNSSDLTDEEYISLEKLILEVEDRIYDNAAKLSKDNTVSKEHLISKLFQGYDYSKLMKEAYNNPPSLNSEITEMSPSDLFIYYHTILTTKASTFNDALKDIVNESLGSNKQLIIPIFSQEYAARVALACIVDINFMNNSTELTKEFENSITNQASRDKYKNFVSRLQNVIFINGAPGVGKTTGVDSLVFKLATKLLGEQGAVISGPKIQQTVNLLNSITGESYSETEGLNTINDTIKDKNLIAITTDMLLNSILVSPEIVEKAKKQFNDPKFKSIPESDRIIDVLETQDKELVIRINPKYLTTSNFKSGVFQDQRLIFIDEVTQLSKFELELLSAWAQQNDKILITSGDLLQSGYAGNDGAYLGIDVDTNLIYTPTLATSLRITNIHKKDNADAIRVLTERVRDVNNYYTTGEFNLEEGIKIALSNYENVPSLKYYEDDVKLCGEKIVGSISTSDIDKLVRDSEEPVGFIYDNVNSDTYKLIDAYIEKNPGKVRKFKLEEVQGSEAKYFIVDKKFNFGFNGELIEKATRDLYTAITRSKEGTIIINNGLTTKLTKGSERISYTQSSILNSESAKSFSELRLKALNASLENKTIEPQKQESSTTSNSTSQPNVELGKVLDAAFSDSPEATREIQQLERVESKVEKHSPDSFICYSYRTRIKPKTEVNGDVTTYSIKDSAIVLRLDPNTEHRAFFNGEVEGLNPTQFERVDEKLLEVKSILYNYGKSRRDKLFKDYNIEQDLSNLFNDISGNTGTLDLSNGKFVLKATKYYNKSTEKEDSVIRIIYEIPILNSSTEENTVELYIVELPNINNESFKIKDSDTPEQKASKAWFIEYQKFYGQIMNSFALGKNGKANKYFQLREDFELERITNSIIYKGSDKKKFAHVPFESKEAEFRGIYFSKPYIVTNTRYGKSNRNELLIQRNERLNTLYNDYYETLEEYNKADNTQKSRLENTLKSKSERLNAEINKNNIKGKAVVFATHSKYIFDENDNIISEDQYGDYYINQMNGKYDNDSDRRDKIRMIILNPEGQTFQSFISKYREFINSYKKNSGVAKYNGKFYKSYFGDFIGFDTLLSIYNYYNYLKTTGKPESKHIKIAEKLLNSLSALSAKEGNAENPFDLPSSKVKFGLPHILRIMERLHMETTPEEIKKMENYSSTINGNDVLKFINKIIEFKINQRLHPELLVSSPIINEENGGIFQDWNREDGITDLDIIDFMEFAMLGRRNYKQPDGSINSVEAPNYNPLFKNGIFPFPVYELTDKKTDYTGGEYFYEARIPEGQYYIDRDIQTPQFVFQPSRDLASPNTFGIARVENNREVSNKDIEKLQNKEVYREELYNNIKNKLSTPNIELNHLLINNISLATVTDSMDKDVKSNIDSTIDTVNAILKTQSIKLDEISEIDYIEYKNNEIKVYSRPTENIKQNDGISEGNDISLSQAFGKMFDVVSDPKDLEILRNITKVLLTYDSNNLLVDYITKSEITPDTVNLILSNMNIQTILSDINKIRSKYNIC
jgi:hypothetical protein